MWDVGCKGIREHKYGDRLLLLPSLRFPLVQIYRSRSPRLVLLAPTIANENGVCGVHQTKCIAMFLVTSPIVITTVFVDTRLWKTKHTKKRFHKCYRQIGSKPTNHNH